MAVTIKDVAKRLDLSIATVSRALDGYPDISLETRHRVSKVAQEMGYIPNRAARQLRRRKSDAIGYVLPSAAPRFSSHFYSEFIAGLGDETALLPYDLLISSAPPDDETEKKIYTSWASSKKVDGFILNRIRLSDWRVQFLSEQKIPFTAIDQSHDGFNYPHIETNGYEAVKEVVTFLISKGYRNIGFAGGPEFLTLQHDRLAGYKKGMEEAGLSIRPEWIVSGNLSSEGGYQAAKRMSWVPDPPQAIVCVSDETAFGVMRAARELGLKIGDELAVTGFDGVAFSEYSDPPLTTLDYPVYEMARQLVKMLVAMLEGKELPDPCISYRPTLQKRASTGD
jgi:LacI family transcriptional regulator